MNMDILGDHVEPTHQEDGIQREDDQTVAETNQDNEAVAGTKKRDRMCMLTHSQWSAQCADLGLSFGRIVNKLNARAPTDRDLAVSFSLTISFDVVERSNLHGQGQVLRRGMTKHYVSSKDILMKQFLTLVFLQILYAHAI